MVNSKEIQDEMTSLSQEATRYCTPYLLNPHFQSSFVHLSIWVAVDDYTWWEFLLWDSFHFLKKTISFERVPPGRHISTIVRQDFSWPVAFTNTVLCLLEFTGFNNGISNQTGILSMFLK